ncbi:hypothetical protein M9Y10_002636 [Tritrichomonas musculus]|uniref:USP domain-containing protein n=1 Tax=Tritrichomonas musculus TaxID=1915356 RepID=A0ABR2LAC2_9EUKA
MNPQKKETKSFTDKSAEYFKKFINSTTEKSTFIQVQRLIWEKSLFPNRFPPCSVFLCSLCNCKSRDLSFCLQCGRSFCGNHFSDHHCSPGFGVDILTRQLFILIPNLGRRFIFNSIIDLMLVSAKLSVIDGIPIQSNLGLYKDTIIETRRAPMPLQNLGNTCWLNSLLQCLAVNPLLQKWFLSGSINITKIDCAEAAVHKHLTRLFLSQNGQRCFSLPDFLFSIWTLFPSYAKQDQFDSHEFFMPFREKLDAYYQSHFEISVFNTIFSWQFKVIESCESCEDTRTYITPSSDLLLRIYKCSSLNEAIAEYLLGASPRQCSNCNRPCKCQSFFNTLPPTLTIYFVREKSMDKGQTLMQLSEDLSLDDYVDIDKKTELGEAKYTLIGLVERPGLGDFGHEYAYVKKFGHWFKCDDNNVSKIDKSEILRAEASLLFYVRKGFFV